MVVELNRSGTSAVNADGLLPGTDKKDDYTIDYTGDHTHTHTRVYKGRERVSQIKTGGSTQGNLSTF